MGKIMKYEFRSMFRLFLPMWLGILALSLVNRFTVKLQFGNEPVLNFLTGLTMFLYVVGIMAVLVVAFIFVILRQPKRSASRPPISVQIAPIA